MKKIRVTELTVNETGEVVIESREVAKMLKKEHKHLLRDITRYYNYLTGTKVGLNEFFQESQYTDRIGRKLKCYLITKKGCEFLANKLTGKKGTLFTAAYISKFHELEKELNKNKNCYCGSQILIPLDKTKYWNMLRTLDENIADDIIELTEQCEKLVVMLEKVKEIKQNLIGTGGLLRFSVKKLEGK